MTNYYSRKNGRLVKVNAVKTKELNSCTIVYNTLFGTWQEIQASIYRKQKERGELSWTDLESIPGIEKVYGKRSHIFMG